MIFVRPMAGLGNRMSVINSCILMAKNNNNPAIKMVWDKNEDLNANFYDLFMPIPGIKVLKSPKLLDYFAYYKSGNKEFRSIDMAKSFLFKFLTYSYKFYNNEQVNNYAFNESHWNNGHSNVALSTYCDLYKKTEINNNYFLFKPSEELNSRITNITQSFSVCTVGVHIRRTDNTKAILHSKDDLFITRMQFLLDSGFASDFFLSTDDLQTETYFRSVFGSKIKTLENKVLNRNSPDGIYDAVVDMFCLSKTRLILGSYWSSFSLVSSNINKVPLEIIT